MMWRYYICSVAAAVWILLPVRSAKAEMPVRVSEEIIELEPGHTNIDFRLPGKLHTTNGHFALKRGTIRIDPITGNADGEIVIDATSENSNEDLRDVIAKYAVLDVDRYPEIVFIPEKIQGVRSAQDDFFGEMWGTMRLHGGIHKMTVPLHGHVTGDQLTAACEFLVPYAEWGLDSPNSLSSSRIIGATRTSSGGLATFIFPLFAYLLPTLREIPPNLFWVSDLVDVKVETQGRIVWAAAHQARRLIVIVAPPAKLSPHCGM